MNQLELFIKLLEHSHSVIKTHMHDGADDYSRLEWLGEHFFEFTTYESEMVAHMAKHAIEVAVAISGRTTFEYQQVSPSNERWYLVMCNMPFFAPQLEWGTSIRGAWFLHGTPLVFSPHVFFDEKENQMNELAIIDDEITTFFQAMMEFVKEEISAMEVMEIVKV